MTDDQYVALFLFLGTFLGFIAGIAVGVYITLFDKDSAELIHAETLRTEAE